MADIYPLFPARVPFVDKDGRLTDAAIKSLRQIVRLFGGDSNTLPVSFVYIPASGMPFGIAYLGSDGSLTSTAAPTNGQLLIGSTGTSPVLGAIAGTVNRVTVSLGAGTITLNLPQDIHTAASPTFADLTLTNLTARSFLYSGVASSIDSTAAATNGQILIGSTGSDPVAAGLTGTANQITVTNGPGSITLSLPQNIAVGSSPTFAGLTLSSLTANSFLYSGTSGALTTTTAPTNGQLLVGSTGAAPVRAALTGTANQVVVTNGAGSITLSLPQDIGAASNVTFGSVTSAGAFGCNGKTAQTAATVNGAVTGTAGVVYTGTEQTMINDLKALVNQLRTALVNNGIAV
jgi:hypothetical protein